MKKRIVLFFIVIICICSCYDIVYVGIADRYMGTFRSRNPLFGANYDKYLYVNVKSGGVIIYFGGENDTDITGVPGYDRIEYINFIGDGNVYNLYNSDYTCKLVFRSDNQVEVTINGQGIINHNNVVCDKIN